MFPRVCAPEEEGKVAQSSFAAARWGEREEVRWEGKGGGRWDVG